MNLRTIDKYMGFAGVGLDEYSIGNAVEGKFCLLQRSDTEWEVFEMRQGQKVDTQVFEDNELACYHLFGVLAERHIASGQLVSTDRA